MRAALRGVVRGLHTHAGFADSVVTTGFPGAVGHTPLIRLRALSERTGCNVLAKAEFMNPGGSVKDRAALFLIEDAEKRVLIKPGGTVVEGTAGNTGIGLVHVCNSRGYKCVIYMPNTQSQEKMDLLRALGADVRPVPVAPITDPGNFNNQARDYAASLTNAVWCNQFDNVANRTGHEVTTGPEIWRQTQGTVSAFTCATGTGGTLAGVARFLKSKNPGIKIFLADPPGSVLHRFVQSKGAVVGERSGSSITEGIGQGRVTDNLKDTPIDDSVLIPDEETIAMVYTLLKHEGLFIGASSALNVVAAGKVAERLGPGHTVVTMMCDGAHRYMSRLFSKKWLESKGLLTSIPADCAHLVTLP